MKIKVLKITTHYLELDCIKLISDFSAIPITLKTLKKKANDTEVVVLMSTVKNEKIAYK